MKFLLEEIRACQLCAKHLPQGPRPVLQASKKSKIAIIGQAPGSKVHKSGIAWKDPSGDLLRKWLGVDDATFYNPDQFALIPMGFCYPGKGKSGDLPPRAECAPQWHSALWAQMPEIQLTILIGKYSQSYYLNLPKSHRLTDTVKNFREVIKQGFFPLPHPSPRNRYWLKHNPWFGEEVLPVLEKEVNLVI